MKEPTLKQFDEDRKKGVRPSVLCCYLHDSKILFMNKREYGLWMLPQGGIKNTEPAPDALKREAKEEMGEKFSRGVSDEILYFGEFTLEFPEKRYGITDLKTDDGEEVLMKGKKFYFYAVPILSDKIFLEETEFDDYFWANYDTALALTSKIYQVKKRGMTEKVLSLLKEADLIS